MRSARTGARIATVFLACAPVMACAAQRDHIAKLVTVRVETTKRAAAVEPEVLAPTPPTDEPKTGPFLTPCVEGTPEHTAATAKLSDLGQAIRALPIKADPKPLATRLEELLATPCFLVATPWINGTFTSARSLATFWEDGGEAWASAPLTWGRPADRYLWLAPSVRVALDKESTPTHPLAPLLCSVVKPGVGVLGCGAETRGWQLRAENAFRSHANAERASFLDMSPQQDPPKSHASCIEEAKRAKKGDAFVVFRACMEQTVLRQDALPLGRFQAPKDGWFVLRGRRGHHSWCNELRAYDLATGAAYTVATCGGMFAQPSQGSALLVEKGKMPVEALREAAWMMMLAGAAEHSVLVSGYGQHIPDDITIRAPESGGSFGLGGFGSSSGRTTLVFQWVRGGKSVVTGTVDWPNAYYGAAEHATELLAIAEAGFAPGCPPTKLPVIPWDARADKATRVSERGYFPEYVGADFSQLEVDLAKVGKAPCP
jgi:hypothetical protein